MFDNFVVVTFSIAMINTFNSVAKIQKKIRINYKNTEKVGLTGFIC